jgi:hypothetical protein
MWLSLTGISLPRDGEPLQPLVYAGGWTDYGFGYEAGSFHKDAGGRVHVQGVIRGGAWGLLAGLPPGYRPAGRLIFSVNNHDEVTRVDVTADGSIAYSGGAASHGWVSLSGISFHAQ